MFIISSLCSTLCPDHTLWLVKDDWTKCHEYMYGMMLRATVIPSLSLQSHTWRSNCQVCCFKVNVTITASFSMESIWSLFEVEDQGHVLKVVVFVHLQKPHFNLRERESRFFDASFILSNIRFSSRNYIILTVELDVWSVTTKSQNSSQAFRTRCFIIVHHGCFF